MSEAEKIKIMACEGVEGPSIYVNGYRVAGPKPWGGAPAFTEWTTTLDELSRAIPVFATLTATVERLEGENTRLLAANDELLKLINGWIKRATRAEAALSGQGELT